MAAASSGALRPALMQRAVRGPTPRPPGGSLRSPTRPAAVCGAGSLWSPFCPLRVLPRRCAALARVGARRPRSGARYPPLRRSACVRAVALRGARCRRCPGLALAALRAPWSVALAPAPARPLGSASGAGVPLAPFPFALPAPAPCAALRAACSGPSGPGAFWLRAPP